MKMNRVLSTLFITFCLLQSSCLAVNNKKSYIVYLGGHDQDVNDASKITETHFDILGSLLGSKEKVDEALIYSYNNKQINGFAVSLNEEDAAKLAEHPDVVSMIPDGQRRLHTTRSWSFLQLDHNGFINRTSLWSKGKFGEGIIIANLDTGVWPESESFIGDSYDPIPTRWKGGCQNQTRVPCNKKLIGAKYYNKGYQAAYGKLDPSLNDARDHDGHGSHTLSTAGGNYVSAVSINDIKLGNPKGGSPRARVAAYKVCWPQVPLGGECADSDIVQGFEAAIEDGVDVISVSLGGSSVDYKDDPLAVASFHAFKKGISVVFSAGNDGPDPKTVTNVAPWVITVGASTIDREFQSSVNLLGGLSLKGLSMSKALPTRGYYSLLNAADAKATNATVTNATLCQEGALDPKKVKGKILVCLRGGNARTDKSAAAGNAGAVGMILCNDKTTGEETVADPHTIPATHITYADGLRLYAYLNSTNNPRGYLTHPVAAINIKPAPFMAAFSSRGPNTITPEILKPDITAPGVNIIAAYTQEKKPVLPYNIESGTSMSCPHVSGVVGLLRNLHPDWSPSAIKSAIMTTAKIKDNAGELMTDETKSAANPFSRGAGDINPNHAMNPGLVYELTVTDYLDFLCSQGYNKSMIQRFSGQPVYECPKNVSIFDFNYPSITVPKLNGTVTITRKLTNVGKPGTYAVHVRKPVGVSVDVTPKLLTFGKKGDVQKFEMTMKPDGPHATHGYVFGDLTWTDGKHNVKSPIVVSVA